MDFDFNFRDSEGSTLYTMIKHVRFQSADDLQIILLTAKHRN